MPPLLSCAGYDDNTEATSQPSQQQTAEEPCTSSVTNSGQLRVDKQRRG